MKLIKENMHLISRIFVMHIGMMIFGMALSTACSQYHYLLILSGVVSTVFYLVLLYITCWDQGSKDIIRIEGGRLPDRPWLGFFAGASAAVVEIVLTLLLFIGFFFGYGAARLDFGIGLFGIVRIILGFWQAPYLGITSAFLQTATVEGITAYTVFGLSTTQEIYYLITVITYILFLLPSIAASGIGYIAGTKNFYIFPRNRKKQG